MAKQIRPTQRKKKRLFATCNEMVDLCSHRESYLLERQTKACSLGAPRVNLNPTYLHTHVYIHTYTHIYIHII